MGYTLRNQAACMPGYTPSVAELSCFFGKDFVDLPSAWQACPEAYIHPYLHTHVDTYVDTYTFGLYVYVCIYIYIYMSVCVRHMAYTRMHTC